MLTANGSYDGEWINRVVIGDLLYFLPGFEYCLDHTVTGYVPVEKTYHLHRRRRWVRNRKRNPDIKQRAVQVFI